MSGDEYMDNCDDGDSYSNYSKSSISCNNYYSSESYTSYNSAHYDEQSLPEYNRLMFAPQQQELSAAYKLQVAMTSLFNRNNSSVGIYDNLVKLFNTYVTSPEFGRMTTTLQMRKQFIVESEKCFSFSP